MKKRILYYIVFLILYIILAFPIASIDNLIEFIDFENVLILGFGILNCFLAFIFLKWNFIFNIIISFLISLISLLLVNLILKLNLAPNSDAYGIQTAILTNAIISIALWEITFQAKIHFAKNVNDSR
ncbi:hypothetical protein [Flavobacterium sp. I3-2]|uniref:hypothetical protein n=1 Tax=Flavobacterium sp. I3-2 TaxID=2748319 RepID=UPI0015AB063B|nr:hypothetical protein [Flavobacterium sp. I3-2]